MAKGQGAVLIYDSKGVPIRWAAGGPNRLIGPATQNFNRKWIPLLNDDFHRNLSNYGRKTLLTLGRHIYFASGAVRGAVEDLCTYAAGSFMLESRSADADWKEQAEDLLYLHDRTADIAGPPHTMRTYRKLLVRSLYLDGDMGTVYLRGEDGRPYLQTIPSHRICSDDDIVNGGPWDGARIIDGVIVDGLNRAIAFRVNTGPAYSRDSYVEIPATSMALHFLPIMAGQVRGLPILGLAGWDMQDLDESKRWELLAQKAGAGRVFQEWNEDGEPQPGADYIISPSAGDTTSSTPSGLFREVIDGGLNTYFKANSGSRLEAVKFDRPAANQQAFVAQAWREALAGARLSLDFNLDLTKIGGASLRVLIDKINLNHEDIRCEVIEPASRRFDFFRLGSFIANGELPLVEDWFDYEYQPGERLTADKRYDADVSATQVRIGVKTRSRATMELGESLEDVREKREAEADELYAMAERLKARHPEIALDIILARLESDALNPALPVTDPQAPPASQGNP